MNIPASTSNEPQPLYRQVKQHILSQIRDGTWQPGMRVPSENQLVVDFGVSRMTANRALRELMHEGVLARLPGVGTFVKERPRRASLIEIQNIADEIGARGHLHSVTIVKRETITASPALAGEFELATGAKLFHVVLVHSENGTPVQLEERHVNPQVAPSFLSQDFSQTTPTAYLIATVVADELEHTVEATLPESIQRELLDIPAGEPCITLHRRSWSAGRVVTVAQLTYPASRYALHSRYRLQDILPQTA